MRGKGGAYKGDAQAQLTEWRSCAVLTLRRKNTNDQRIPMIKGWTGGSLLHTLNSDSKPHRQASATMAK
jgi:hypothetical protein